MTQMLIITWSWYIYPSQTKIYIRLIKILIKVPSRTSDKIVTIVILTNIWYKNLKTKHFPKQEFKTKNMVGEYFGCNETILLIVTCWLLGNNIAMRGHCTHVSVQINCLKLIEPKGLFINGGSRKLNVCSWR